MEEEVAELLAGRSQSAGGRVDGPEGCRNGIERHAIHTIREDRN